MKLFIVIFFSLLQSQKTSEAMTTLSIVAHDRKTELHLEINGECLHFQYRDPKKPKCRLSFSSLDQAMELKTSEHVVAIPIIAKRPRRLWAFYIKPAGILFLPGPAQKNDFLFHKKIAELKHEGAVIRQVIYARSSKKKPNPNLDWAHSIQQIP